MKKALIAIVTGLALLLPQAAVASDTNGSDFNCYNQSGRCFNSGSHAHGAEYFCYAPDNILIIFAYYGSVYMLYTFPIRAERHFYYPGAPYWSIASWDVDDRENGMEVDWSMGGPHQSYPGQNHLIYEVDVSCEAPDSPKAKEIHMLNRLGAN